MSAEALTIGQTYLIEVYFSLADSGGRSVVKVDHIPWIDYTGDTKPGADTTIDNVFWGASTAAANINGYYDNLIIADDWVGDKRILGRVVTSAGSSAQWTPSTGANWECVDEIPSDATNYNSVNIVDYLDLFTLEDLPATGIGDIHAVQVNAMAVSEGMATPQNLKLALKASTTIALSSDHLVPTAGTILPGIWEVNPHTSNVFSIAEVNALEVGYKAAT